MRKWSGWVEIVDLLLGSMTDDELANHWAKLRRLRRRYVNYGRNGALQVIGRKDAVAKAAAEMEPRLRRGNAAPT